VKRQGKWGHPRRETCDNGADELSQVDKHLLVGPEQSLGAQIRDSLEQVGSLKGGQETGEDGVFKGLWCLRALGAGNVRLGVVP